MELTKAYDKARPVIAREESGDPAVFHPHFGGNGRFGERDVGRQGPAEKHEQKQLQIAGRLEAEAS